MTNILDDAFNNWWLAIVFAFGARQTAIIVSRGQFFSVFVELVAVIALMFLVTRFIFRRSGVPNTVRFEGLIWFVGAVLSLMSAIIAFMLSRVIKAWSDTEFMGSVLDTTQLETLFAVFLLAIGFVRALGREHTVSREHLKDVDTQVAIVMVP